MFPSRATSALLSAALLLSLPSPGAATLSAATAAVSTTPTPKSCSGAFRYAARVGNSDIVEVSPVQAFAKDRRLTRMRYTARGMYADAGRFSAPLVTTMCGAR
jgi:hypothetical protein